MRADRRKLNYPNYAIHPGDRQFHRDDSLPRSQRAPVYLFLAVVFTVISRASTTGVVSIRRGGGRRVSTSLFRSVSPAHKYTKHRRSGPAPRRGIKERKIFRKYFLPGDNDAGDGGIPAARPAVVRWRLLLLLNSRVVSSAE